jgi:hypothetical protein
MFCLGDGDIVEQIGTKVDVLMRCMLEFESDMERSCSSVTLTNLALIR